MKPSLSRSKILNASLIVSASSSCSKSKRISAKDVSPEVVSGKEAESGEVLIGQDKITVKASTPLWPSVSSIQGTRETRWCRFHQGRPRGSCWAARPLSGSAPWPSSRPGALCEKLRRCHPEIVCIIGGLYEGVSVFRGAINNWDFGSSSLGKPP